MIIGYEAVSRSRGILLGSVGEHSRQRRRRPVRDVGASGKANVGISNDKGGGMPPRRKTKVSRATLIAPGSVGS